MNLPFPFQTDSAARQITVRSAVNPSLWACAVISIPLFFLASRASGWISVAFFIVGTLPVASFVGSYVYLLLKNPDYLRSEEYQLKVESLKLLGSKGNPLQADADDIVSMVNNPELPPPDKQT